MRRGCPRVAVLEGKRSTPRGGCKGQGGEEADGERTDLEGLGIPVLDLVDGGHVAEIVGKLVKLLDSVSEANRKLLCMVVRGLNESWSGS